MRNVLERAEEVTRLLSILNLKNVKLLTVKIANKNPATGSFRIKGFLNKDEFIEIFEFLLSGERIKYAYSLIKEKQSILRYDNAPHHIEIQTHPHHKHLKNEIELLKNPQLNEFVNEVKKLINLRTSLI